MSEEIFEFLEEVAAGPYEDSDLLSLLDTLSTRAQYLIEKHSPKWKQFREHFSQDATSDDEQDYGPAGRAESAKEHFK